MYNKKILQHFTHPRNFGKIKNPDGIGTAGNPICGDILTLYIKVEKRKGKEFIENIKFETLGCAAALAVSSMITEMVKGKSLEFAQKITKEKVSKSLGGLPPIKMHCSNLGVEALHKAIEDYKGLGPKILTAK